jgi:hypothetical protein
MRWSAKPRCQTGGFEAKRREKPPLMRFMVCEIDLLRSEEQVRVVGHDDKGVELIGAGCAIVLEGFEEEVGIPWDLEESAAVVGDGGDEEGADGGGSRGFRHAESIGAAEEGRSVIARCALHSGLRQRGSAFRAAGLWPA